MFNSTTVLFGAFLSVFSISTYAINSCPKANTYHYKGVECCIKNNLTKNKCRKTVENLSPHMRRSVMHVRRDFLLGKFEKARVPNCFWTSFAYTAPDLFGAPRTVYERELFEPLRMYYEEVNEPHQGDLILYSGEKTFYHDIASNGGSTVVKIPFHSAVYLGDGLVFQKENSSDEIFSVVELKDSFAGYENAFHSQSEGLSGDFFKTFYRLKD